MTTDVTVRAMQAADVEDAERLYRFAFGTYFQFPEPMAFRGDAAVIGPRWRTYPDGGIVAVRDGRMIGMSCAANWGSVGVLGPVAVHPELWKQGLARRLLGATLDVFDRWGCRIVGLFTFPQSATHLRLYQEFGFWPRTLMPAMAKPVGGPHNVRGTAALSARPDRAALVAACRALTDSVYAGLDLGREIATVLDDGLGEVVLLLEGDALAGFAICHAGAGSEGGSKSCGIKFALVRSGETAPERFRDLVFACEDFARMRGIGQVVSGVTTGRHVVYRIMCELGFRTQVAGVAMHRPFADAYDRPDIFAIDDWR
jgi:GNAT superfamily N-acetyltransferase